MQFLYDYQPQAFGKYWSQDAEYKDLQKEFFDVDMTHGSSLRSVHSGPLNPLKSKKKTKRIR